MIKNILQRQNELMEKFGWFAHFKSGGDFTPFGVNYHTHGLERNFNHPDIQICFPIEAQHAHQIIINVVRNIKEGVRYEPGKMYKDILEKHQVQFIRARDNDRRILRLILPDDDGSFDSERPVKQFSLVDNSEEN